MNKTERNSNNNEFRFIQANHIGCFKNQSGLLILHECKKHAVNFLLLMSTYSIYKKWVCVIGLKILEGTIILPIYKTRDLSYVPYNRTTIYSLRNIYGIKKKMKLVACLSLLVIVIMAEAYPYNGKFQNENYVLGYNYIHIKHISV